MEARISNEGQDTSRKQEMGKTSQNVNQLNKQQGWKLKHNNPFLPVFNAHLCVISTPILGCTLEKKRIIIEEENRGGGYAKLAY